MKRFVHLFAVPLDKVFAASHMSCAVSCLFLQAWAKEYLLREQNKELATFRMSLVHCFDTVLCLGLMVEATF